MKTQPGNLFKNISVTTGANLTGQADTILAKDGLHGQSKTFGLVDMWNIHRQKKSLVIR